MENLPGVAYAFVDFNPGEEELARRLMDVSQGLECHVKDIVAGCAQICRDNPQIQGAEGFLELAGDIGARYVLIAKNQKLNSEETADRLRTFLNSLSKDFLNEGSLNTVFYIHREEIKVARALVSQPL